VSSPLPSGLNAGFVGGLLEQYLENPEAVDPAWRALFEHADDDVLTTLPGLARLVRARPAEDGNGAPAAVLAPPAPEPAVEEQPVEEPTVEVPPAPPVEPAPIPAAVDVELVAAVASAMALVDAIRTHGHLAARLDPLGSEPLGDPALDEAQLAQPLTPELQERIPALLLGVHVEGETLAELLPRLREVYCGPIAYEIEHISDHAERVWLRRAIESGRFRQPLPSNERRDGV